MKLIPLDALVAEIERLFEKAGNSLGEYRNGAEHMLISIKDFIDSMQKEPTGNPLGSTHAEFRTAVESLGVSREEHASGELEQAIDTYLKSYWGGEKEKQDWPFLKKMAIHFAKWQEEQINEALLSEVLPCFMHGGEADEVVAKLEEVLNQKK